MKIAHLSTFPDMKCGIAFYAADLICALRESDAERYSLHYGANPASNSVADANVANVRELILLAEKVNTSDCHLVCLQHEFGIWGGENGEHIFQFMRALRKPLVSTLHTTFSCGARPLIQYEILRSLVLKSSSTFVLTPSSRKTLLSAVNVPPQRVEAIPHGIPTCALTYPPNISRDSKNQFSLISIGFFRPDKGIESTLQALAELKAEGLSFDYTFAGTPQAQFAGQHDYLEELRRLVRRLGLEESVRLRAEFLDRSQQIALIQGAHAGIFAYQDPNQSSSGTIPLVIGCGRPVICTPFEFAQAKKNEIPDAVHLASDFSAEAIKTALRAALVPYLSSVDRARQIFDETLKWRWEEVAKSYHAAFEAALRF